MTPVPKSRRGAKAKAPSEYGAVTAPGTVRIERLLPGPIERVWAYLTESEKRGRWLATGEMELRAGGKVDLFFHHADLSSEKKAPDRYKDIEGGVACLGRITRCEPPRALSYTWGESSGEDSEVTFELTPRGKNVLLVVTHRRLADRATLVSVAAGWHAHLGILIDRLAGEEPRPFWTTHARLEAEYGKRIPAERAPRAAKGTGRGKAKAKAKAKARAKAKSRRKKTSR